MTTINRRQFLSTTAAFGVAFAWAGGEAEPSRIASRERRDLYPEGVASGDPDPQSVLLWTRRPYPAAHAPDARLHVEVSEDAGFTTVVATSTVRVLAAADWTCRVLVGNLKPSRFYWYRFIDDEGYASRVGRTRTAPTDDDDRARKFVFVSCQNINTGYLTAYRRMIFEDEQAPDADKLEFVLHLGDFVYELVWYPEDNPHGALGRPLRDVLRYPHGEAQSLGIYGKTHIPTTLEDYRLLYQAHLQDPDLQDARARWPFVCIWDNEEFSDAGWQSLQLFEGENCPAQTRKVAAFQAWFEYQPARITKASGPGLEEFGAPHVENAPIRTFDDHGFGDEPNNRLAVGSLTGYRAVRWGRHLDVIVTDQRSYRSETPTLHKDAAAFTHEDFPDCFPQEAVEILDAGRTAAGGSPPATIRVGDQELRNFRQHEPPQTMLGVVQKQWFLDRLKRSTATWKIWGNSQGTLDFRLDPQHLPPDFPGLKKPWPGAGYAVLGADPSLAYVERAEIYAMIRDHGITGFATVCGDRHSFEAGLAAPSLPPRPFEPVGVAFVTGSISSPGMLEGTVQTMPKHHPLRGLYLGEHTTPPEPVMNLLFRLGVRAALAYQQHRDLTAARAATNPDLAPHLKFVDLGGHGYATVRVSAEALDCEFVCIPHPITRSQAPDGGPLRYRVRHRAPIWKAGETPRLEQHVIEGDPRLSL